jgi:hypothetical protein
MTSELDPHTEPLDEKLLDLLVVALPAYSLCHPPYLYSLLTPMPAAAL